MDIDRREHAYDAVDLLRRVPGSVGVLDPQDERAADCRATAQLNMSVGYGAKRTRTGAVDIRSRVPTFDLNPEPLISWFEW